MKKLLLCCAAFFMMNSIYSQNTIESVLKEFDTALMSSGSTSAETTIGAITYADTETCGTIVSYLEREIKKAAEETRRIKIVQSADVDKDVQVVVATRSLNMGMMKKKKTAANKKYVLDGKYKEKGNDVELVLTLFDQSGNVVKSSTAVITRGTIDSQSLTLYPKNVNSAQEVQKDFETASEKTSNGKISIAASMIDESGNLVRILHPGDTVRFKIMTDSDAYIAIQGFDAEGDVYWLPVENNFIKAGQEKIFPDGNLVFQVMDGIFGAEHLVIHAASTKDGLPDQSQEAMYKAGMITGSRGIGAVKRASKDGKTGMFKISYTVIQ